MTIEERALELYPVTSFGSFCGVSDHELIDLNEHVRKAFIDGFNLSLDHHNIDIEPNPWYEGYSTAQEEC